MINLLPIICIWIDVRILLLLNITCIWGRRWSNVIFLLLLHVILAWGWRWNNHIVLMIILELHITCNWGWWSNLFIFLLLFVTWSWICISIRMIFFFIVTWCWTFIWRILMHSIWMNLLFVLIPRCFKSFGLHNTNIILVWLFFISLIDKNLFIGVEYLNSWQIFILLFIKFFIFKIFILFYIYSLFFFNTLVIKSLSLLMCLSEVIYLVFTFFCDSRFRLFIEWRKHWKLGYRLIWTIIYSFHYLYEWYNIL